MTSSWLRRLWYAAIYYAIKYRYVFLALVLIVVSLGAFRYWRELTRDPYQQSKSVNMDSMTITMWYPDRITVGPKNAKTLELIYVVTPGSPHENKTITTTLSSPDKAVYFEPQSWSMPLVPPSLSVTATLGYRQVISPAAQFVARSDFLLSASDPPPLDATIAVDRFSKQILAFVTFVFTAFVAVLSLLMQLRSMFSGKSSVK